MQVLLNKNLIEVNQDYRAPAGDLIAGWACPGGGDCAPTDDYDDMDICLWAR
jgi:hypothetical protein